MTFPQMTIWPCGMSQPFACLRGMGVLVDAPFEPRPLEVAGDVARAARWLAAIDVGAASDAELLGLVEVLGEVTDRLVVAAVLALGEVADRGAALTQEGLLTEAWLGLVCRRTGVDRRMLLVAGEMLASLPHVAAAARAGRLSWSELRVICVEAARLSAAGRAQLDRTVAADPDALSRMGPDDVVELVRQVVAEWRPERLERTEDGQFQSQFVAFQGRLDGTGTMYGELDSVTFTEVAGRVEQAAEQLPNPPDRQDAPRWKTKGQRQAVALHALVTREGEGPGTSAQVVAVVESDGKGQVRGQLQTRRGRRAMSAALLWKLIGGAEIRRVLTDGRGVPLKVGRTRRYATAAQRAALLALYRGCSWPGCAAPWWACQIHHVIPWDPRAGGGRTDDDNLVPLCGIHHHAVTHGYWTLTLLADRSVQVRRRGRVVRSRPRGLVRARGPDPPSTPTTQPALA